MSTISTSNPEFRQAVAACVSALRHLAEYELEPPIARRLEDLSERKEFLTNDEHAELMGLVSFAQRRTIEKLDARLALKKLRAVLPEIGHRESGRE